MHTGDIYFDANVITLSMSIMEIYAMQRLQIKLCDKKIKKFSFEIYSKLKNVQDYNCLRILWNPRDLDSSVCKNVLSQFSKPLSFFSNLSALEAFQVVLGNSLAASLKPD